MDVNIGLLLILAVFLITADIILVCNLMIFRIKKKERQNNSKDYGKILKEIAAGNEANHKYKIPVSKYFKMKQVVQLNQMKDFNLEKVIDLDREEKKNLNRQDSKDKTRRLQTIVTLGLLETENARKALEKKLLSEKDYTVKIYIANALADIGNSESIPVLTASLLNAHRLYRTKVNMLISDFGDSFNSYIPLIRNSRNFEMKELLIDYSGIYYFENTKKFLVDLINHKDEEIEKLEEFYLCGSKCCKNCINHTVTQDKIYCIYHRQVNPNYLCRRYKVLPVSINPVENYRKLVYKACEVLSNFYPEVMIQESYLNSEDFEMKNYAIKALANIKKEDRIEKLLSMLGEDETARTAGNTISFIIEQNPRVIIRISEAFHKETDNIRKKQLAKILSARIEYFILKLELHNTADAINIIREILRQGRTNEIIDFLNNNKNIDIENELIAIVREVSADHENLKNEFSQYLDERLLKKCGFTRLIEPVQAKSEKKDKKLKIILYLLLAFCISVTPAIYILRYWDTLLQRTFMEHLERFIIDFNYYRL